MVGTRPRVAWIDGARGIAITLVVLFHAGMFTVPTGLGSPWWASVNLTFALFRMPLFFLVAGMLATGAVSRSWRELWRTRLSLLTWVFLVWTVLRFAYYRVIPEPIDLNQSSWLDFVLSIVRPSNGLWFLFALAVFLVFAKLVSGRRSRGVAIGVAAVAACVMYAGFTFDNVAYDGIVRYFVFFLLGLQFRDRIIALADRCGWLVTAGFAALFVAGIGVRGVTGGFVDALTAIPIALFGVAAGIGVARNVSGNVVGRLLEHLGRKTLQVYVTHILLISTMTTLLLPVAETSVVGMLRPVTPILMAALAIPLSLLIAAGAERVPVLRCLYESPAWFSGLPGRRALSLRTE